MLGISELERAFFELGHFLIRLPDPVRSYEQIRLGKVGPEGFADGQKLSDLVCIGV